MAGAIILGSTKPVVEVFGKVFDLCLPICTITSYFLYVCVQIRFQLVQFGEKYFISHGFHAIVKQPLDLSEVGGVIREAIAANPYPGPTPQAHRQDPMVLRHD